MDWNEAAAQLKRQVRESGRGFVTLQKDALKTAFAIGAIKERGGQEIVTKLDEHGLFVHPHPYYGNGSTFRIYDVEHAIGKVARAVVFPDEIPETSLVDVARLYDRERAAKDLRSDDVPWIQALDVFFQVVIGRPPDGWEDLRDDRHPRELAQELAASLELSHGVADAAGTVTLAGAVCAFRPRGQAWEAAPRGVAEALGDAARAQAELFDRVIREAAKHLLGQPEIPNRPVELGRLGLRYRREAQGGVGWMR